MWLALNRTRIGMIVRAGVDDRDMLVGDGRAACNWCSSLVFAFGAGLAGMAGIVGGTFQSISPGEDIALPAGLAGRRHRRRHGIDPGRGARRRSSSASPSNSARSTSRPTRSSSTFLIMVLVLAVRPQGLLAESLAMALMQDAPIPPDEHRRRAAPARAFARRVSATRPSWARRLAPDHHAAARQRLLPDRDLRHDADPRHHRAVA